MNASDSAQHDSSNSSSRTVPPNKGDENRREFGRADVIANLLVLRCVFMCVVISAFVA